MKKAEISIPELFRILLRRKWIIIATVIIAMIAALLYNIIKSPVYESSVLIKKESVAEDQKEDKIQSILGLKSRDLIDTEIEFVQTRKVLDKVIDDLSLNIHIVRIEKQDGTVTPIDLPLSQYMIEYNEGNFDQSFPKINMLKIGIKTKDAEFKIANESEGNFKVLVDKNNKNLISAADISKLPTSEWLIDIDWTEKGEIFFETTDYNKTLISLLSDMSVVKKINTNLFNIFARSEYPMFAQLLANTITKNYKDSRISLYQDNIKHSYNFIDNQLSDISKNLKNAENNLSDYKTKEKIAQIDEQSKKLVEFISNLESEKMKNDLEIGLYKNKLANFENEMLREGYVDQTYLTPEQYQATDSPFSNLLTELNRLELNRLELLEKRTEKHPDVIKLTDQINKIKSELSKYNSNTVTAFQIIYSTLLNKQDNLNSLISRYNSKLERLPDQEAKLASLIRQKEAYEKMYKLMLDKREEMRVAEFSKMQDIVVLDNAIEPLKPISPNKKLNLGFASLFGLILGIVLAFVKQFTDKKISDIEEIERDFSFPILSVLPPYNKSVVSQIESGDTIQNNFVSMMENEFSYKEAFRTLETKTLAKSTGTPKTVMFTSCEEGAGKSTATSNLAITASQSGKKVLLIDCDIKKPSIAELFGLPKFSSGLIDYLTEKTETPNIFKPVKLTKDSNLLMNLDILPTGGYTNISGEILASDRMKELLKNLTDYDLVILDTPPITRLSDALSLGRIVKDTVLVIRAGQTVKESISWAVNELKSTGINFLGTFVNNCEISDNSYKYKYGYPKS